MREKRCYVASSKETEFVLEDITSFIKNIKKEKDKDIWLVGGGKMINQFITSLIYKCIVTIIPTILDSAKPARILPVSGSRVPFIMSITSKPEEVT
jgi:dihydrofolate reductase